MNDLSYRKNSRRTAFYAISYHIGMVVSFCFKSLY